MSHYQIIMVNVAFRKAELIILKVLIILHLAEQITNGSTGFATDKCNRFITFNIYKNT